MPTKIEKKNVGSVGLSAPALQVIDLAVIEDIPVHQCGNCKHWRPRYGAPSFGECAVSAKASPSPVVTQDLSVCSAWAA